MSIVLDHIIVHVRNPDATARFLTDILGLESAGKLGHFTVVRVGPSSLDLMQTDDAIASRHFTFRVNEPGFDAIFDRIRKRGLPYWADPFHRQPGEINRWDDGRGVYFDDPDGHVLEVITRPYGSGGHEAENPNPLLGPRR